MSNADSTKGRIFLLISAFMEGLAPVLMHRAGTTFPPALFVACVSLVAAGILGVMVLATGNAGARVTAAALRNVFGVTVFIMGGFLLILIGTRTSSGISTALLLQTELIWTLLFSALFLHERIGVRSLLGAAVILTGTLTVVWQGLSGFGYGELVIIGATALFPFGNVFAKRALRQLPAVTVLLLRYVFAAILFFPLSFVLGEWQQPSLWDREAIVLILAYAVFICSISKVFWYGGLKRHSIHVSVSAITTVPAFSLLFAYIVLGEVPTAFQWTGFTLTMLGLWILLRSAPKNQ